MMYYNCGTAIAKRQTKLKLHFTVQCVALTGLQKLIMVSLTFPHFPGEWSPCSKYSARKIYITRTLHHCKHNVGMC